MSIAIVIFGASGDLAARKLVPALYSNFQKGRLPEQTRVIGFSTSAFSDEGFRQKMEEAVRAYAPSNYHEDTWHQFASSLSYQSGRLENPEDFRTLVQKINGSGSRPENHLFYLATAPVLFPLAVSRLSDAGLLAEADGGGFRRIIIEKPFGRDLGSALALNRELHDLVPERQIYRIDHYLGKETVQNVLVVRFGNAIFEPLWNRNYVDHVQITVAETVGVEHRARYYEKAGALKDMFQNHLLQLLTLVAMEPPTVYEADALRNEKVKVLAALREIPPEFSAKTTVRGQYEGYTAEPEVDPASTTETFAAVKFFIETWRWQGVPFYLRSGKMLQEKSSEILVQFRRPPTQILDIQAGRTELVTNSLSMCIQPDEGLHLRFITKVPDEGLQTRPVNMEFHYRDSFGGGALPEAYERLLLDALRGDASLFARSDEIEHAWRITDGIRSGWESEYAPPLQVYTRGSWGPSAADTLINRDGRRWEHHCRRHGDSGPSTIRQSGG
jgi:glucose-6-phosphate 1-dehydrogenase